MQLKKGRVLFGESDRTVYHFRKVRRFTLYLP